MAVERGVVEPEALIKRFVRAGLDTAEQLRGCSVTDIPPIETALGLRLPASYRDFLLAVGCNAGRFYETGHLTYPDLLRNHERAKAILDDARSPFRLPTDAVVFLASSAGEFSYFHADLAVADPPGFHYMGLDGDPKAFRWVVSGPGPRMAPWTCEAGSVPLPLPVTLPSTRASAPETGHHTPVVAQRAVGATGTSAMWARHPVLPGKLGSEPIRIPDRAFSPSRHMVRIVGEPGWTWSNGRVR